MARRPALPHRPRHERDGPQLDRREPGPAEVVLIDAADVIGKCFPGGTYTIDAGENATVARLLGTEPAADGTAHPVYAYIATRVGCGYGVEEILNVVDSTSDDGPMVASLALEYSEPLRVGETYEVSGEFTGLVRKEGRRAGTFDLLEFDLRLTDSSGNETLLCTQSWVIPRRNLARA